MKGLSRILGSVTALLLIGGAAPLLTQTAQMAPITPHTSAPSSVWSVGDVFLGVSNGQYQVRAQDGTLKEIISDGRGGFTTGCAFDTVGNLYATNFGTSVVDKYSASDPHPRTLFGSGYSIPESIVFDAQGRVYVGNIGGIAGIQQFAADGTFLRTIISTRVDWFDIAADQDTIYYTQEGIDIKAVSISMGAQLPNFTTGTAGRAYAMRILPDGGVLLADNANIKRYNSAGVVVQTYSVTGEGSWFSLNLDPNGTSFWSGGYVSANLYRFNIQTGAVEAGPINTGNGPSTLFGICVLGEITVGAPSPTVTETGTPATPTSVPTASETQIVTPSQVPTASETPAVSPTENRITPTVVPTDTPTAGTTPSETPTDRPRRTPSNTPTDTRTPRGTSTPTPASASTSTFTPVATTTFTPTSTDTATSTPTGTATATTTFTPVSTDTATSTPTPGSVIVGHTSWQGIPQPGPLNTGITETLILCSGGVPSSYTAHADAGGFFTVTVALPNGAYNWWLKSPRNLADAGTLTLSGGTANVEFGMMRGGDANNNDVVDAPDFNMLKQQFGATGSGMAADFNNDGIVNSLDFTLLKANFGAAGAPANCP
jgi:hypothetical protein